ncbi:hypothetical protein [Malikia sp.]|uniref:hypothetical protein n=1 Tax=Malikia sp. TaxID=2070706 RepID=UPI00260F29AF|nr:hypothetical protein [Malikia sp.]MDD2727816.1 hypothetical protein [Malikia sp.]
MQTLYADGIANIRLIDGIVRLDLVNIQNLVEDKAAVQPVGSLAMTLPALLRTHQQLSAVLEKMVEQGLLKREQPVEPVAMTVS